MSLCLKHRVITALFQRVFKNPEAITVFGVLFFHSFLIWCKLGASFLKTITAVCNPNDFPLNYTTCLPKIPLRV